MCSMLMGCDGDPMRFGATSGATILAGADDAACLATLADPLPFPFCETFESGLDPARWTYNQSTTLSMASNNPPSRRNALLLNGCCAGCPAQSAPDDIRTNYILLGEVPEGTLSYHTQHKGNGGTAGSQLVIDYLNNAGRWIEFNRVTSDGTTQTAYTQWTHALPADSLHDGFRLRFRLDGGPTHPDWFIDDITITSVQPDSPVLFVRADAPPGGTGTSWASALNDLQDALAVADCSLGLVDEIWVAEGTYRPDRDTADRSDSFRLLNGIAIYGGFRGVELVRTERDPSSRETVLSGELGNPVSTSDNSFHIVTASGTNSTAVLDGFTITRGNADGAFPDDRGGGLLCTACNAAIRNCTWRDLRARQGGAMFITSGSPLIDNCLFMDNNASFAHGGAVAIDLGSSVRVERSRFINNFAATTGGAVDVTDSSLSVGNSLFAHNLADEGAAIYNLLASVTLNHSTLTNNGAFDSGGGIMNVSGITTVRHGIFWNNIDEGGTGESAQLSGDPSAIDYCLVQGLTGSLGGTGNLSADPAFANILGQDNIAGTIDDDFRLTPGSPAINAGDPSFIPAAGAVDLDGHPRVLAGTVDLGVYEFGIGDFDGSGNVDTSDLTGLPQCMTGPNGPPYVAGCEVFDFDGDADVDLRDYRAFESAASDGF